MANSIRSYKQENRSAVVQRRLQQGTKEMMIAIKEKRSPVLGLGYWGALAARNNHGI